MATLLELKQAIAKEGAHSLAKKIMILGKPKSGKSVLAATIAKVPAIERIYYFDLESSIESVLAMSEFKDSVMALSPEELNKITYIPVADTHERPLAAETILKCFTATGEKPADLCTMHGKVNCRNSQCSKEDHIPFALSALRGTDAIILDSGSQLADSILSLEMQTESYKDLRKYYGAFTIEAAAVLSAIQAAKCNVVVVTHLLDIMSKPADPKDIPVLLETVPLFGSQNFSKNKISKYFGWTLFTEVRNGKFLIGSSPTFKSKVDLGNRANIKVEAYPDFDLSWIYKPLDQWPEPSSPTSGIKAKTKA